MRWFRRKRKEESEQAPEPPKTETSIPETSTSVPPEEPILHESSLVSLTNPIEAYIQRLDDMLADPEISAKTKALKDTRLQLIVGGEPVLMKKEGVQPMHLVLERSIQTDVFIRMSEEAASTLAMTTSLNDFKKAYKKMVGAKGEASYVSIKLHTPLEDLRSKGYFSIELLRILIDA
jgi:hypothetical protein